MVGFAGGVGDAHIRIGYEPDVYKKSYDISRIWMDKRWL
jgi:hypothetical protein